MLFRLVGLCICLAPLLGAVETISVGRTELDIPLPEGFVKVDPDSELYRFQDQFVPASNHRFLSLMPAELADATLEDQIAATRTFSIQTSKTILEARLSQSQFDELRSTFREGNETAMADAREATDRMLEEFAEGVEEVSEVELALSISGMVPLAPHVDTERILAYAMYLNLEASEGDEQREIDVGVAVVNVVYVKSKVLFLYANAPREDLEWARTASQDWANAVIEANPGGGLASLLDWDAVLADALQGAVIGLLVGAAAWFFKRRKSAANA